MITADVIICELSYYLYSSMVEDRLVYVRVLGQCVMPCRSRLKDSETLPISRSS